MNMILLIYFPISMNNIYFFYYTALKMSTSDTIHLLDILDTVYYFPVDIGNMISRYYYPDYIVGHINGSFTDHIDDNTVKDLHTAIYIIVYGQLTITKDSVFGQCIRYITGHGRVILIGDMNRMFYRASLFNCDVSNWDVSGVTNMSYMFAYATLFNGDLSKWNVSNVIDMSYMFSRATSFNGDVSSWDVSRVTNMHCMFANATSFIGIGLSSWDVSRVTDMCFMFSGAISFKGVGLSKWDVSSITTTGRMCGMFIGTYVLVELPSWYTI